MPGQACTLHQHLLNITTSCQCDAHAGPPPKVTHRSQVAFSGDGSKRAKAHEAAFAAAKSAADYICNSGSKNTRDTARKWVVQLLLPARSMHGTLRLATPHRWWWFASCSWRKNWGCCLGPWMGQDTSQAMHVGQRSATPTYATGGAGRCTTTRRARSCWRGSLRRATAMSA
jgi:hypothetical protein